MDSYTHNEYEYPGDVPVSDQMPLYGGGDHSGPAQPDHPSTAKDTLGLGSADGPGWDFTEADLPR